MGFVFELDQVERIGRWSLSGSVTDQSFRDSLLVVNDLLVGLDLRAGVIDFTEATAFEITEDALKQLAQTAPVLSRDMLRLVVAPENEAFLKSRTFVALSEMSRPNLFVVRNLEAAYHILGTKSPNYTRLASSD